MNNYPTLINLKILSFDSDILKNKTLKILYFQNPL